MATSRLMTLVAASLIGVLALARSVAAQPAEPPPVLPAPAPSNAGPPGQPGPSSVSLAGQIEIARLVDLAAQRLGLNIEYDAAALKALGSVTLRLDAGLSDQELWLLVNRVLAARGYTTVKLGPPGNSTSGTPTSPTTPATPDRSAAAYSVVKLADAAMRPLEQPDLSLPPVQDDYETDLAPDGEPAMLAALDDSAFHVPLWFSPPPPPPSSAPSVESQPAPLPPFKLQLLAIVREPGVTGADARFKALLYDPDADKIVEAAAGQSIGERTVVGITEREITLSDRAGTRTLSLRPAAADAAGGGS